MTLILPFARTHKRLYRQTLFYCTSLCWLFKYCVFPKLKVCGNPPQSKAISTILPTVFVHLVSLCHILVILTIFQTFSLLYLLWGSAISDPYYCNCLGHHKPHPCKTVNVMLCEFCLLHQLATPRLSFWASLFLDTQF